MVAMKVSSYLIQLIMSRKPVDLKKKEMEWAHFLVQGNGKKTILRDRTNTKIYEH